MKMYLQQLLYSTFVQETRTTKQNDEKTTDRTYQTINFGVFIQKFGIPVAPV